MIQYFVGCQKNCIFGGCYLPASLFFALSFPYAFHLYDARFLFFSANGLEKDFYGHGGALIKLL